MFSKLALFAAASMAIFVAALPQNGINDSCNGGVNQCCNSVEDSNSNAAQNVIKSLGLLDVPASVGTVGLDCNPIALSSSTCTQQPTCCAGNSYQGGLLVVSCSPINVNA